MTMPLCEAIQTTPAIQAGARILAPLLLHSSNVAQKRTEDERMRWFRYTRGETWDKEFNSQLKDLEAIAPDIKRAVERSPNVTIKKIRPDTKPPQTTLERLDAGWLQVPAGYNVFLISYASEDCTQAVVETRADIKDDSYAVEWLCGSGVVLFECIYFRTEPPGIPYASIPVPISHSMKGNGVK
ncbi:hypothetical protein GQ44DRAFT_435349 [Phaeosphaeriaceae sp. PMI808]|nr:hypothetical protein GQ44DRAFT_435349 [Phaeosphaeriaceae sp. PMI808]